MASTWILLLNAVVGFQLLDDGTPLSIGLILFSAVALFVGTGYIALDTGYSWTGRFDPSLTDPNRNIGLYVLYQLAPLVFLVLFVLLEIFLVLKVLGEFKPLCKASSIDVSVWVVANASQYISSRRPCSLPSARSFNTSSAPISATRPTVESTERSLRLCSRCCPSSPCGSSGRASPKTTGPCFRRRRVRPWWPGSRRVNGAWNEDRCGPGKEPSKSIPRGKSRVSNSYLIINANRRLGWCERVCVGCDLPVRCTKYARCESERPESCCMA